MRAILAVAVLAFAVAGCASSSTNSSGTITHAGSGDGTDTATKDCGTKVNYSQTTAVTSGSVAFTVKDSSGATKFTGGASSSSGSAMSQPLTGNGGVWSLTAVRSGGFGGSFTVSLSCG